MKGKMTVCNGFPGLLVATLFSMITGPVRAGPFAAPAAGRNSTSTVTTFTNVSSTDYAYTVMTLQGVVSRQVPSLYVLSAPFQGQWLEDTVALWPGTAVDRSIESDLTAVLDKFADSLIGYVLVDMADDSAFLGVCAASAMDVVAVTNVTLPHAQAAGLAMAMDLRGKDMAWLLDNFNGTANGTVINGTQAIAPGFQYSRSLLSVGWGMDQGQPLAAGSLAIMGRALHWPSAMPWSNDALTNRVWHHMSPPFLTIGSGPLEDSIVGNVSALGGALLSTGQDSTDPSINLNLNLDFLSGWDVPRFRQGAVKVRGTANLDQYNLTTWLAGNSSDVNSTSVDFNTTTISNGTDTNSSNTTGGGVSRGMHTVCFVMSGGEDIRWLLTDFSSDPRGYGSPDRGQVPLGWTISPALADLAPVAMHRMYSMAYNGSQTDTPGRDVFVASPSGLGYQYPDVLGSSIGPGVLKASATMTGQAMAKADLRVLTMGGRSTPLPPSLLFPYLEQEAIDAVFVLGQSQEEANVPWIQGKPVLMPRCTLQANSSAASLPSSCTPSQLVDLLLSLATDPRSGQAYSLVAVDSASTKVSEVVALVQRMGSMAQGQVEVLGPDEFVARMMANVPHEAAILPASNGINTTMPNSTLCNGTWVDLGNSTVPDWYCNTTWDSNVTSNSTGNTTMLPSPSPLANYTGNGTANGTDIWCQPWPDCNVTGGNGTDIWCQPWPDCNVTGGNGTDIWCQPWPDCNVTGGNGTDIWCQPWPDCNVTGGNGTDIWCLPWPDCNVTGGNGTDIWCQPWPDCNVTGGNGTDIWCQPWPDCNVTGGNGTDIWCQPWPDCNVTGGNGTDIWCLPWPDCNMTGSNSTNTTEASVSPSASVTASASATASSSASSSVTGSMSATASASSSSASTPSSAGTASATSTVGTAASITGTATATSSSTSSSVSTSTASSSASATQTASATATQSMAGAGTSTATATASEAVATGGASSSPVPSSSRSPTPSPTGTPTPLPSPPGTCYNGVRDGDETDVDCGGYGGCERCGTGLTCRERFDCAQPAGQPSMALNYTGPLVLCDSVALVCTDVRLSVTAYQGREDEASGGVLPNATVPTFVELSITVGGIPGNLSRTGLAGHVRDAVAATLRFRGVNVSTEQVFVANITVLGQDSAMSSASPSPNALASASSTSTNSTGRRLRDARAAGLQDVHRTLQASDGPISMTFTLRILLPADGPTNATAVSSVVNGQQAGFTSGVMGLLNTAYNGQIGFNVNVASNAAVVSALPAIADRQVTTPLPPGTSTGTAGSGAGGAAVGVILAMLVVFLAVVVFNVRRYGYFLGCTCRALSTLCGLVPLSPIAEARQAQAVETGRAADCCLWATGRKPLTGKRSKGMGEDEEADEAENEFASESANRCPCLPFTRGPLNSRAGPSGGVKRMASWGKMQAVDNPVGKAATGKAKVSTTTSSSNASADSPPVSIPMPASPSRRAEDADDDWGSDGEEEKPKRGKRAAMDEEERTDFAPTVAHNPLRSAKTTTTTTMGHKAEEPQQPEATGQAAVAIQNAFRGYKDRKGSGAGARPPASPRATEQAPSSPPAAVTRVILGGTPPSITGRTAGHMPPVPPSKPVLSQAAAAARVQSVYKGWKVRRALRGWAKVVDDDGDVFFQHTETGRLEWVLPAIPFLPTEEEEGAQEGEKQEDKKTDKKPDEGADASAQSLEDDAEEDDVEYDRKGIKYHTDGPGGPRLALGWRRCQDDEDVWYVNDDTGDNSWEPVYA